MTVPHPPIIILGAARSGTRLLRSVIAAHPSVREIPFDINFIWKYGNYGVDHDELSLRHFTARRARFVREFFDRFHAETSASRIVEKTVSNTLRVEFVREVFPDCQLVHLVRDGRDVAASARKMWQAPMNAGDVIKKVRYFPPLAVPTYGVSYLRSYLHRKFRKDGRVKTWGPRFVGIDAVSRTHTVLETCGIQWHRCVDACLRGMQSIPEEQKIEIRFEDLVLDSAAVTGKLLCKLGLGIPDGFERRASDLMSASNVGKWKRDITSEELDRLMPHIEATMGRLGYET
jgi:hypothetical protein